MKTIIYAILYVIVTPFWWFVMQIDNALSKLYMHISIKFLERNSLMRKIKKLRLSPNSNPRLTNT